MSGTIPLAQYLFTRLQQLNCRSIHGVPGDFFLRALDHLHPAGVRWIGNANELCAGYAADGYARASHHLAARRKGLPLHVGAVLTTYGVGELSAINAIAGSYAESIPVVHMVGTPSRKAWQASSASRPIHHTLGDGRMRVYADMAKNITCAQVNFHDHGDPVQALKAYDEVLEKCVIQSKPVYVSVPSDMVELPVPADMLGIPLQVQPPPNDSQLESEVVGMILECLEAARKPLLIADGLCYPFDLQAEANELSELLYIPSACFTAGKGIIQESKPSWIGALSGPAEATAGVDLVILLGPILSDTNTAAWTAIPASKTISFHQNTVEVESLEYNVQSKAVLRRLIRELKRKGTSKGLGQATVEKHGSTDLRINGKITQDVFWKVMNSYVQPNDTLLLANGTPLIGGRDIQLPSSVQVVASNIWCSIGQMLPAAQGVALAKRDHGVPGRTILFEGDGSFQVTCQALSDIIRYKLDVNIFILNNGGYTYERWLHGIDAEYNDVLAWSYTKAADFFGGATAQHEYRAFSARVKTMDELHELLRDSNVGDGSGLKIIEVVMDPMDIPRKAQAGLRRASQALEGSSFQT